MHFRADQEDAVFTGTVKAFLDLHLPAELRFHQDGAQLSRRSETLAWQSILHARGWGAPHWPKQHGGTGWTPRQRMIFDIECSLAGAPWINQQGMNLLGPIVNSFGTEEQRERFVAPLIRGETYWCQGFSEPNAGSDLASLQTFARRDGEGYRVTGQKIWTSHAELSDWIFLLVRTERTARKQAGITFLVSPIDAPGIIVRPIRSIDGLHHLTEVFLDEVEIPVENRIGDEGQGWSIAKHLLGKERIFGACDLPGMLRELHRLKGAMARRRLDGRTAISHPLLAARLARLDMEAEVLVMAFLRAISGGASDRDDLLMSSILKVKVTELHQAIVALLHEVMGPRGPFFCPDPFREHADIVPPDVEPDLAKLSSELMYRRASSIYGGTNEIQRDIIARMMFD